MKLYIFKLTTLFTLIFITNTSYAQYCIGGPNFDTDADVESLSIVGSNSSINYTNDCFMPALGFQDETFQNVTLIGGTTYTGSVGWSGCPDPFTLIDNTGPSAGTIWIDWNDNNTFETSEVIHTWSGNPNSTTISENFTINTPSNVPNGVVRLRVSMEEGGSLPLNPCATFSTGSMIDFSVTVTGNTFAPTSTLGTPQACLGDIVEVPMTIEDGDGIGAISYKVTFDTSKLEFVQSNNLHAHFNTNFNITNAASANALGEIIVSWYDGATTTGQNFGTSTLLNLVFNTKSTGNAALNWITTAPYGELTNGLGGIITGSIFTDGSANVLALPTVSLTSDDADNIICAGETVIFTGAGGTNYDFKINGTSVQSGTTNTYTTSNLTNGDVISVEVFNANGCSAKDSITMAVGSILGVFDVTGGGLFCTGSAALPINLSGSEIGVEYILLENSVPIDTMSGTGAALVFSKGTATTFAGNVYTITAYNAASPVCTANMTGNAIVILDCYDITMTLIYDNGLGQPLKNTPVTLYNSLDVAVGNGTSDHTGQVTFTNISTGTDYYILSDLSGKAYGGINATDALLISLDFVNIQPLTGLKDRAGDVDGNGGNNASDALQVANRFVGNPYNFVQDWLHDKDTTAKFDVTNANVSLTANVLAFGDVNGSYDVSNLNNGNKSEIYLFNDGEILASENAMIEIPFYAIGQLEAGAVSLVINYPYDVFDVEKVVLGKDITAQNLQYVVTDDGRIRLTWFGLEPIRLGDEEALLKIIGRVHDDLTAAYAWTPTITLGNESELANEMGEIIEGVSLTTPSIVLPKPVALMPSTFEQRLYPTPAHAYTNLEYHLPEDALITIEIYNATGGRVVVLLSEYQKKGIHTCNINTSNLPNGMVNVRVKMKTGQNVESYTNPLMIVK